MTVAIKMSWFSFSVLWQVSTWPCESTHGTLQYTLARKLMSVELSNWPDILFWWLRCFAGEVDDSCGICRDGKS